MILSDLQLVAWREKKWSASALSPGEDNVVIVIIRKAMLPVVSAEYIHNNGAPIKCVIEENF